MLYERIIPAFLFLLLAPGVCGCATGEDETAGDGLPDHAFRIQDGLLTRDEDPYTIAAVHLPEFDITAGDTTAFLGALGKVADVGGTAIAIDLDGFSEDGAAIDEALVTQMEDWAKKAREQHQAVVLRVLDRVGADEARDAAAAAAGKAFNDCYSMVYWFDGPGATELADRFKEHAPNCITVAPDSGDIRLLRGAPEEAPAVPVLVTDALPRVEEGRIHYAIEATEENYARIEAMNRNPKEDEPWEPGTYGVSDAEQAEGFVALFNGEDLSGWWAPEAEMAGWMVEEEDGVIHCTGESDTPIYTVQRYGDFDFRFDFKIVEGGNSGVFIRAPRAARQSRIGFEFQIMGDSAEPADESSTGSIYDVVAPMTKAANPEGEWNSVRILAEGPHIQIWLNDQQVQDVNYADVEKLRHRLMRGFIGLQDHDHPVWFRDLRIKQL